MPSSGPTELQSRVFILAWVTYFAFYVSREPYSLVKSTLLATWYPFNSSNGWLLLGILDTVGLAAYAIGIFIVGYLCERFDSLYILVWGCLVAGVTTILYGMAYYWDIHNLWYFIVLRILNGLGEAGGWPTLIKMLDHHFNLEEKRVLILTWFATCKFMGIIAGSIISSFSLTFDNWGACFIYCGAVVIVMGLIDLAFLPNLPATTDQVTEHTPLKNNGSDSGRRSKDISEGADNKEIFCTALAIPGVAEYALQLFFVKLSVYILYYWLPTWLVGLTVGGDVISYFWACWYTALWGAGGVVGTLLIGYLAYIGRLYGVTSATFCAVAGCFVLWLFYSSTGALLWLFLCILFGVGVFQNGPYSLASACMPMVLNQLTSNVNCPTPNTDSLGNHGNIRLVGMATGIIDGSGSIGAIFGPLSAAVILQYTSLGWALVFLIVALAMFLAALTLVRQMYLEVAKTCFRGHVM